MAPVLHELILPRRAGDYLGGVAGRLGHHLDIVKAGIGRGRRKGAAPDGGVDGFAVLIEDRDMVQIGHGVW